MTAKKLRLIRLKKLHRQELNKRLAKQKGFRRKQSLWLLRNPGDPTAKITERQLTGIIGELKQARGMLPHP